MTRPSAKETPSRLGHGDMKKIALLLGLAALLGLGLKYFDLLWGILQRLLGVFSPFIAGGAIAFVLNVPMRQIEKGLFGSKRAQKNRALRRLARPVSLVITLVLVAAALAVFVLVLAPQLGSTWRTIAASAEAFWPKFVDWLERVFDDSALVSWLESVDWAKLAADAGKVVRDGLGAVLTSGFGVVASLVSSVVNFFIGLIFSCYVLAQKERLANQARRLLRATLPPRAAAYICRVVSLAFTTFSSFVRGQCVEAIILGAMFVVTLSICRMPYALMIGVLVAFTALIPVFGAFIGCVIGAIMILMVNPIQALLFVVVFQILQQIEGNLIYPHVVGNSVGLPSIWVLVAVTVGGSLMGVLGMLVFIPLASVCYALLREWTNRRNATRPEIPDWQQTTGAGGQAVAAGAMAETASPATAKDATQMPAKAVETATTTAAQQASDDPPAAPQNTPPDARP